jgi:hypothetical protein
MIFYINFKEDSTKYNSVSSYSRYKNTVNQVKRTLSKIKAVLPSINQLVPSRECSTGMQAYTVDRTVLYKKMFFGYSSLFLSVIDLLMSASSSVIDSVLLEQVGFLESVAVEG